MSSRRSQHSRPNSAIDKFRDDIDPENTWVVSDTHFGHDNIVEFCHRPPNHEDVMIAEWREAVPDDATVLHLGDLCYRGNAMFKHVIAPKLTGRRKLLIRFGNHDKGRVGFYRDCGWSLVRPFSIGLEQHADGLRAISPSRRLSASFCHYPWNDETDGPMPEGHVRLHGHIHNNGYTRDAYVPFLKDHINLSVEQTKYRPVNLKLLLDGALLGKYPEQKEDPK